MADTHKFDLDDPDTLTRGRPVLNESNTRKAKALANALNVSESWIHNTLWDALELAEIQAILGFVVQEKSSTHDGGPPRRRPFRKKVVFRLKL